MTEGAKQHYWQQKWKENNIIDNRNGTRQKEQNNIIDNSESKATLLTMCIKTTFGLSLPQVVCGKACVLFTLFMLFFPLIVVSNTYCFVFLFVFFVLCTLYCQFLWIVHFWLPLRCSLTFIHNRET
jgi:hypothetical protein